jgi:hypothetical protein
MDSHEKYPVDIDQLKQEIEAAVVVVRQTLDATRNPRSLDEVPHTYGDKFLTVELATRATLAAQLNALAAGFGLDAEKVAQLQARRFLKTVTLRFTATASCTFTKTTKREVEADTRLEERSMFGKTTYTSVETITEHWWEYVVDWSVAAVIGTDEAGALPLRGRTGRQTFLTRTTEPTCPMPEKQVFDALNTEITWLLDACAQCDGTGAGAAPRVDFVINRADRKRCHTPRRNAEVDSVLENGFELDAWAGRVRAQMERTYRAG